jgi:methionyl-tRNA formyltransferase
MTSSANYIVATIKSWNVAAFDRSRSELPGKWSLIERQEDLAVDVLRRIRPRYVFLPHWSWRVPDAVIEEFECVCFHMTDVPYGRGGSPLQNLILRGHRDTMMSALRMVHELDAGPIYLKRPLSLAGAAQAIYERAADVIFRMIDEIVRTTPEPEPQTGSPVLFERRRPEQSRLPENGSPESIYDFIRMLDAEGYPHAYVDCGQHRLHLTNASLEDNRVVATASFSRRKGIA